MFRSRHSLIVLFGTTIFFLAIAFSVRPDNFIVDDGYFYPQIARYIAHGYGSTFNGWMPTNGYHPLWMLVCVVAAKITSLPIPLLEILGGVEDMLILFFVGGLVLFARAAQKRGAALGVAILLFMSMVLGTWRLLETDLALALQVAVLAVVVPIIPQFYARVGKWRDGVLGCLLGLTMLARLDLIFFVMVILGYELFSNHLAVEPSSRIKRVITQGALATVFVTPYLIWNYKYFHHFEPVSGFLKSSFPYVNVHASIFNAMILVPVGAIIALPALFRKNRTTYETIALLTGVAAMLHYLYTQAFGFMSAWYPTTGFFCFALGLITLSDKLLRRTSTPFWLEFAASSALMLMLVFAGVTRALTNLSLTRVEAGNVTLHRGYVQPNVALAERLNTALPAGSRIYIYDGPGGVAFHSTMSILPADGLVTNFEYIHDLAADGFLRYAKEHNLEYVIAPYLQPNQAYDGAWVNFKWVPGGETMEVRALGKTRKSVGTVVLTDANLIFRAPTNNTDLETTYPEVGLWRIGSNSPR